MCITLKCNKKDKILQERFLKGVLEEGDKKVVEGISRINVYYVQE
jgi:hypothetical protein